MHETIRVLINSMVNDVVNETISIIKKEKFSHVEEIRNYGKTIVKFSDKLYYNNNQLRSFLHKEMYKHTIVNRMTLKAKKIISDLFNAFSEDISVLPTEWRNIADKEKSDFQKYRIIADYIAGMTDRYAVMEHKRLFDMHDGWKGTSLYDKRDR